MVTSNTDVRLVKGLTKARDRKEVDEALITFLLKSVNSASYCAVLVGVSEQYYILACVYNGDQLLAAGNSESVGDIKYMCKRMKDGDLKLIKRKGNKQTTRGDKLLGTIMKLFKSVSCFQRTDLLPMPVWTAGLLIVPKSGQEV